MNTQIMAPQLSEVGEAPFQETCKAGYSFYPVWLVSEKDVQGEPSQDSAPQLWVGDVAEGQVRKIERLMSEGKYTEALTLGLKVRGDRASLVEPGNDDSRLTCAEFDLHYARAFVYIGDAKRGILRDEGILADWEAGQNPEDIAQQGDPHSMEGSRRNYVLGRAHNDLGYAYFVEQGRCALAPQELESALPYFRASGLWEEYANTCNNIGRVYTQLYQRGLAEEWADKALELRLKWSDEYRVALSLRLQSSICSTFDPSERAYHLAMQSFDICERQGKKRGIGLACITVGSACRQMGNLAGIYSYTKRVKCLEEAADYLGRAVTIFMDSVEEPVRLIEAYYELGCVYRDQAKLARDEDANPALAVSFTDRAVELLRITADLTRDSHPLWYVDACLALVETALQAGQFRDAHEWLERAYEAIPPVYVLQAGEGLAEIPIAERIEGFWYRLGKIELLCGHLTCDRSLNSHPGPLSRGVLIQAVAHYALAMHYFRHYSKETPDLISSGHSIYSRLQHAQTEDIHYMREQALPSFIHDNGLDAPELDLALDCALMIGQDQVAAA